MRTDKLTFPELQKGKFRMIRENGIFSLVIVAAIVCMSAVLHADEKPATVTYSIGIKGMTCERCVASVQKELTAIPGVVKVQVDDKAGHAWVTVEAPQQPRSTAKPRRISAELAAAVTRAGANHGDGFSPTVNYVLTVQGMTCEACSRHIQAVLAKVPGVAAASVSYEGGYAVITPSVKTGPNAKNLVSAVEQAGYKAVVHTGPDERHDRANRGSEGSR
jgi:copper chaperone CopZ